MGPNWKTKKTKNGYPADEVLSALQKEIRRGNVENAVYWTYELCLSGMIFQEKLWERLTTIAVEDVGLGNPQAILIVRALNEAFHSTFDKEDDKLIQALFASAYLAQSPKDRLIDEMKSCLGLFWKKKAIPDYAIDRHTKRGKRMGRGMLHFWEEGAKIHPEKEGGDKQYLQKLLVYYRSQKPSKDTP